jgi:hypothetical protein
MALDVNEFGWATAGNSGAIDEASRAGEVSKIAGALSRTDCDIDRIFLHTWRTAEIAPANVEDWYGVADPDTGAPRATATAYANALHAATGRPPGGLEPVCDDEPPAVEIQKVATGRGKVTIRFSANEQASFRCKLGNRRWRKCRSPVRYPKGARGIFRVQARDRAGNQSVDHRKIRRGR